MTSTCRHSFLRSTSSPQTEAMHTRHTFPLFVCKRTDDEFYHHLVWTWTHLPFSTLWFMIGSSWCVQCMHVCWHFWLRRYAFDYPSSMHDRRHHTFSSYFSPKRNYERSILITYFPLAKETHFFNDFSSVIMVFQLAHMCWRRQMKNDNQTICSR